MAMNIPATTDADKAYAMKAAEFRSMPNDEQGMAMLHQATSGPFGALALIEIDKRTRAELMNAVQQQNANQQDQTMLQQALQRQAQANMMNKLANDERVGLNNIIAQAEQGALEFGQPMGGEGAIGASEGAMPMGAGGGVVAFQEGGRTPISRFFSRSGILNPSEASEAQKLQLELTKRYGTQAGIGGLFMEQSEEERQQAKDIMSRLNDMSLDEMRRLVSSNVVPTSVTVPGAERGSTIKDESYPDESRRGSATYLKRPTDTVDRAAPKAEAPSKGTGIASLTAGLTAPKRETDAEKILTAEDELMKKMGIGEYGAPVKESLAKRRGEAEERFQKGISSETFLEAAKAAGGNGKRMTGLQALAAAVGGAGDAATRLRREKDTAMDKLTEGEEKLLLAQDLYKRGRVSEAQKLGRQAEQEIFDNSIKLKTLDLTQQKINATLASAMARSRGAGTTFKQDIAKLSQQIQDTMAALRATKDPKEIAMLQQQLQLLRAAQARALTSGSGISITDEED
jgi:hypothetical protein